MHHTLALILRKDPWNEADWLITALSRDFGKIRLRAQGARKHGAKLQGHLEPGGESEISFVIGRNGYRLTTARLRKFFPSIRSSFSKLRALQGALTALDANLFEERNGAGAVFELVDDFLRTLERAEHREAVRRLMVWFQVRFLDLLGFVPHRDTAEASQCATLLRFAALGASDISAAPMDGGILEKELAWLQGRVGDGVRLPRLPLRLDFAANFG